MKGFKFLEVYSNYYVDRLGYQFEIWEKNGLFSVFRSKPSLRRFYGSKQKLLLSNKSKKACEKFIDEKFNALINGIKLAECQK